MLMAFGGTFLLLVYFWIFFPFIHIRLSFLLFDKDFLFPVGDMIFLYFIFTLFLFLSRSAFLSIFAWWTILLSCIPEISFDVLYQ